ncbi:MAG TPA: efflux RND transporter periplasmic adaptor subunit [Opitutaceae bacterium]|nr:efflux RND transporter periplasmic adaptor subunit [Opitutaceae bacterium]
MAKSSSGVISKIVILLVLVGASFGVYYYLGHRTEKGPQFSTTTLTKGDIVQSVTATGILQPVLNVSVSSQISGIISKLFVDFNSPVKQGQILVQLDPATYEASALQAEGQLANAKANHQLTKINAQRQRDLFKQQLVSQSDLDTAEANLLQAEAQVKIQQAQLDNAKVNLARCTIYSPIDGLVTSRQVDVGNTVAASLSAPTLFVIANDLTKMQIDSSVSEADIGSVELNQSVNFTVDAYPNRQFHGKVFQIRNYPTTQQNVVVYDSMVEVNNSDLKLKPGMTANVSIIIAERPSTLRIPNSALRVRMPDGLIPVPKVAAGPAADGTNATRLATKEEAQQLMRDAGFSPGSGPPSPEVRSKMQQLAKDRGLELPGRMGGDRPTAGQNAVVVRTVYRMTSTDPKALPEAVSVKLGVSDGVFTEVLDGLKEHDVVVTGVSVPSRSGSQPANNPFGGGSFGGPRRG